MRDSNPEGKKFERVDRLYCKGLTYGMDLIIDVNCEIYSVRKGDKLSVAIASTLSMDGWTSHPHRTRIAPASPASLHRIHHALNAPATHPQLTRNAPTPAPTPASTPATSPPLFEHPTLIRHDGTGSPDDGTYQPDDGPSLLDQYEYAMHGLIFE